MSVEMPKPEYTELSCHSSACGGQTRKFRRIVLVSEEWTHLHINRIGGPPQPPSTPYAEFLESPLAYCTECNAVMYIGPEIKEVAKKIKKEREEIQERPIRTIRC